MALAILEETNRDPEADIVETRQESHNGPPIESSMASWRLAEVAHVYRGFLGARLIRQSAMQLCFTAEEMEGGQSWPVSEEGIACLCEKIRRRKGGPLQ